MHDGEHAVADNTRSRKSFEVGKIDVFSEVYLKGRVDRYSHRLTIHEHPGSILGRRTVSLVCLNAEVLQLKRIA